ncbi:MAG: type II secretion system protein [Synergistaceae bacterium]|nr:type II secretion system protein [Synergistaceae bacterium]
MKKSKGFTLIELLIVSAIVAILSSMMGVSMVGSTVTARAAAIVSNVDSCVTAAALCVATEKPSDLAEMKADDVLKKYMVKWADYSSPQTGELITYTPLADKGPDSWALVVDFSKDNSRDDIRTALRKIKGFGKYYDKDGELQDIMGDGQYSFKVMLNGGKILPDDSKEEEGSGT